MKLFTSLVVGLAFILLAASVNVPAADKKEKEQQGKQNQNQNPQRQNLQQPGQGRQGGPSQSNQNPFNNPNPGRPNDGRQNQGDGQRGRGTGGQGAQDPKRQGGDGRNNQPGQGQKPVDDQAGRGRGKEIDNGNKQPGRGPTVQEGRKNPTAPIEAAKAPKEPLKLESRKLTDGSTAKAAPSGKILEKSVTKPDGEHVQKFNLAGTKQADEVRQKDGTVRRTQYDLRGRANREEVVQKDGSKAVTTAQLDRDGNVRAKETINYDSKNKAVSKTVERNVTVTKNVTINKNVTVNKNVNKVVVHYDRSRYGFCYRPVYIARPVVFVSWYDPYWYTPALVPIHHPFRYSWGWHSYGWYSHYHGAYWATYDVYPAPSYWVTDHLVAAYVADHYAASASAAQAAEEARLAKEEAAKARQAAEEAKDAAELAEAKLAAAQAELRAKNAEEALAKAKRQEELAGKPNPNATPIDKETKETLRKQIEATIAEEKKLAEESQKTGKPVLPDLAKALADPKHLYPVSGRIKVTGVDPKTLEPTGEDAGALTEGDLVKLAEGQKIPENATENTPVIVKVITSKGEEGEARAGSLVVLQLKDLQTFDSEFRAKLDDSLAVAEENQAAFKAGAI